VFQHHPDNVDHLTTKANESLILGLAFTDFSLEVSLGFIITTS
jgi:hypothetical protein